MPSAYDTTIKCLESLADIQKTMKYLDNEYVKISCIEGKPHTSAWRALDDLSRQYMDLFKKCESSIKG
jgi:hypothetical protein